MVGRALALLLKTQLPFVGSELSLYDIAGNPCVAVDLSHIPSCENQRPGEDARPALQGADVVLILRGVARKTGYGSFATRCSTSTRVSGKPSFSRSLKPARKACIGKTNPVNTTAAIAAEVLKKAGVYDKNKLGVTTLDIIRLTPSWLSENSQQKWKCRSSAVTWRDHPACCRRSRASFTEQEVADLTKRIQNAGNRSGGSEGGGGSGNPCLWSGAAARFACLWSALQGEKALLNVPTLKATANTRALFLSRCCWVKTVSEERKSIGIAERV